MKQIILIIALFFAFQSFSQESNYFFIRHAEKDRADETNKNPDLTEKGNERAHYWSEVLKNVKFDAVYSTNYNRTIQTATPTALNNDIEIQFYDPRKLKIEEFKTATKGKTVLIVGHSNSTPSFVNKLIKDNKYSQIDDSNNSNLYIVTISEEIISDILLKIEHKKSH